MEVQVVSSRLLQDDTNSQQTSQPDRDDQAVAAAVRDEDTIIRGGSPF